MSKIIDCICEKIENKDHFFSFEYFPPKTDKGLQNLFLRVDKMSLLKPLWVDITWGAGGSTTEKTLQICKTFQSVIGVNTMMHLTCTNIKKEEIYDALIKAKEYGVRNILALRGDPPKGQNDWVSCGSGFEHAIDLVKYIREEFGDYFCIAVAGYPEGHTDAESYEQDLMYLKEKVDAGADFVVTQLFYDVDIFVKYLDDCIEAGINCPVIPGIMPIQTYNGFKRMTGFCKTKVPQFILDDLEEIKDNDADVKVYGVELATKMCNTLLDNGIFGLHFYTLNLEKATINILKQLEFICSSSEIPWKNKFSLPKSRTKEDVRPVYWKSRWKSYVQRTEDWDDYPNGRWGDSRSPAFAPFDEYDLKNFLYSDKTEYLREQWKSSIDSVSDVVDVFVEYINGSVQCLPWNENQLDLESNSIKQNLLFLNQNGFLTINSQPKLNGIDSADPTHGWGGPNGFIYQKSYVECFISKEDFDIFLNVIEKYPTLTYQSINIKDDLHTSSKTNTTNALTWGIFPGKEVIQPTVCDLDSFLYWKEEAFCLWNIWKRIYNDPNNDDSDIHQRSFDVISEIQNNYYLLNVVENNFVTGTVLNIFVEIINTKNQINKNKNNKNA